MDKKEERVIVEGVYSEAKRKHRVRTFLFGSREEINAMYEGMGIPVDEPVQGDTKKETKTEEEFTMNKKQEEEKGFSIGGSIRAGYAKLVSGLDWVANKAADLYNWVEGASASVAQWVFDNRKPLFVGAIATMGAAAVTSTAGTQILAVAAFYAALCTMIQWLETGKFRFAWFGGFGANFLLFALPWIVFFSFLGFVLGAPYVAQGLLILCTVFM